jgi:tRNA(Ile)-lysidine synthase
MPLLKAENPKLAENLSAMALRLREDEAALTENWDFSQGLSVDAVKAAPAAKQSRMLSAFLEGCGVREPAAGHIELALSLIHSENPSARAYFPGGITVSRQYDRLTAVQEAQPLEPIVLRCPGVTEIPQLGLVVTCCTAESISNNENTFTVHPEGPLILRSRCSGDEIRLSGGTKSLKKLFIDRKIPANQRPNIPVLADDAGVLGVYGIGVDQRRAAKTLPAVQLSIRNK